MKNYLIIFAFLFLVQSCKTASMPLQKEFIHPVNGYSQVVAVGTGNIKTLYVAGQIGEGKDFESQMRSALANLRKELQACGADFGDIVKMNWYIVDYNEKLLVDFRKIRSEIFTFKDMPASTLVGVKSLARAEWLIEVEAVAVIKTK